MYNKIYDFCKVRNLGNIYKNGLDIPPRVQFITNLLKEEGIEFILDKFNIDTDCIGYNIIMKGSSTKMVSAHHDIVNPNIDNANDNEYH